MAEQWRFDDGSLVGLPRGTIFTIDRDGDAIRIRTYTGELVVQLSAKATSQSASGNQLRLSSPSQGVDATFSRSNLTPGAPIPLSQVAAGPVVVRTYQARSQADAALQMTGDAAALAQQGYYPVSQSWAPGSYGCGAFLVALLLCILLVGFLIFIYMLIVKPDGTLTVTYQLREAAPVVEQVEAATADDTKVCPRCAETIKAAAKVCRYCGHEFEPAPDTSSAPPAEY